MTVAVRPPRPEGLRTLAPEVDRILQALARVAEERDYRATKPTEPHDDPRRHLRPV
jgi:hypothetical protein